ncbi:hypothetical protein, partial [Enterobacter cloacae]|uniref:hypothetical protein n=2 Tax=Enterobacter cloacae TaxID=550 RepID=UPI001969D63C
RIPAAAGIVNLRYKSCPEMAGQDQRCFVVLKRRSISLETKFASGLTSGIFILLVYIFFATGYCNGLIRYPKPGYGIKSEDAKR